MGNDDDQFYAVVGKVDLLERLCPEDLVKSLTSQALQTDEIVIWKKREMVLQSKPDYSDHVASIWADDFPQRFGYSERNYGENSFYGHGRLEWLRQRLIHRGFDPQRREFWTAFIFLQRKKPKHQWWFLHELNKHRQSHRLTVSLLIRKPNSDSGRVVVSVCPHSMIPMFEGRPECLSSKEDKRWDALSRQHGYKGLWESSLMAKRGLIPATDVIQKPGWVTPPPEVCDEIENSWEIIFGDSDQTHQSLLSTWDQQWTSVERDVELVFQELRWEDVMEIHLQRGQATRKFQKALSSCRPEKLELTPSNEHFFTNRRPIPYVDFGETIEIGEAYVAGANQIVRHLGWKITEPDSYGDIYLIRVFQILQCGDRPEDDDPWDPEDPVFKKEKRILHCRPARVIFPAPDWPAEYYCLISLHHLMFMCPDESLLRRLKDLTSETSEILSYNPREKGPCYMASLNGSTLLSPPVVKWLHQEVARRSDSLGVTFDPQLNFFSARRGDWNPSGKAESLLRRKLESRPSSAIYACVTLSRPSAQSVFEINFDRLNTIHRGAPITRNTEERSEWEEKLSGFKSNLFHCSSMRERGFLTNNPRDPGETPDFRKSPPRRLQQSIERTWRRLFDPPSPIHKKKHILFQTLRWCDIVNIHFARGQQS